MAFSSLRVRYTAAALLGFLVFTLVCCARKPSSAPEAPVSGESAPKPTEPTAAETHHKPDHSIQQHRDVKIPTPVASLTEAPLDVSAHCTEEQTNCLLLILYKNRLVAFDWEKEIVAREIEFPPEAYGLKSRAPSGKILRIENSYFLLTNSLAKPVQLDQALMTVSSDPSRKLFPVPEPGMNWFRFSDGRFYDFQMLEPQGIAVVDTSYHLSIAQSGRLLTLDKMVGANVALSSLHVYTSAPTLPGEKDTILKFSFSFEPRAIKLDTSRTIDGQILDLALVNLNQDKQQELLVTVRNERGITIDVLENF